jgi:hypothetical protein
MAPVVKRWSASYGLGNREWERVEESEPVGESFFLTDLFSWLRCIWALDWYDFFFWTTSNIFLF